MEVILLERVEKLGQMGEVVNVRPGFARNFLLPQNKALRATKANLEHFQGRRTQLEAENLVQRQEAEKVATKLDGLAVVLVRQASEMGNLFGSVTARDIAEAVTEAGVSVERRQVVIDRPIKTLGLVSVRVSLHPEVTVKVKVNVARSQEEALTQAKTGEAVVGNEPLDEIEELILAAEDAAAERFDDEEDDRN
ncbi:MAG: 50S ribosomal protein L9 [Alphaproteobacteria bacterium]|nr:50S ribosomal protein L9 [Alphaproteobacteria bacterium]MBU0795597.1 50S ribosomal protein L9 [Alphaproteobacteria bacterium]MBU0887654.1 50S ribosomal protein L9 [Alphaproteobacteria bacterium]MBU1812919.1 50S ribosomal protein L9 [Alphaproteobacteria bacterium]